jgi:hypothetical protein
LKETDLQERNVAGEEEVGLLSLASLLNIFYRHIKTIAGLTALGLIAGIAYGIVVKPLYLATGQVRPGVVSYNPDGYPNREWALEDVVNWFDGFLYWEGLKKVPTFAEAKSAPVIDATFSPSLNFVAGGNVITLTNLARSPSKAVLTINEAIDTFNRQAIADSMGSSLHLTLRRGRATMKRLRGDIEQVDAESERVNLQVSQQEREYALIELDRRSLLLDLEAREADSIWLRQAISNSRATVESARVRLANSEKVLAVVMVQEMSDAESTTPQSADPVVEVLKQTASREQAGRVGDLLLTVNSLAGFINQQTARADSMTAVVTSNELEISRIKLVQEIEIKKRQEDVAQVINDLNIKLTKDLPHEQEVLESELEIERVKVELISPLERVGTVSVSDKPVRPRKMRAAMILTFVAFMGSLFWVIVWDYVRKNWGVISAPDQSQS